MPHVSPVLSEGGTYLEAQWLQGQQRKHLPLSENKQNKEVPWKAVSGENVRTMMIKWCYFPVITKVCYSETNSGLYFHFSFVGSIWWQILRQPFPPTQYRKRAWFQRGDQQLHCCLPPPTGRGSVSTFRPFLCFRFSMPMTDFPLGGTVNVGAWLCTSCPNWPQQHTSKVGTAHPGLSLPEFVNSQGTVRCWSSKHPFFAPVENVEIQNPSPSTWKICITWKDSCLLSSLMKNLFLLNSVCSGCPLWSLLDVSGEDLTCLILTPWEWGTGYITLIWKGKYTITFIHSYLPMTRNLVCIFFFFCHTRYGLISPNNSRELSPRRKRWPCLGKVASCTVFLRPPASPLHSPVWDSGYKTVISLAYIIDTKEPEWESCLRGCCPHALFLCMFSENKKMQLLLMV